MSEPDPVHVAVLALRAHGHVTCAEALEEYAATSRAEVERLKAELKDRKEHDALTAFFGGPGEESVNSAKRAREVFATLAEREAEIERARNAVEPFRDESGTWVDWVEYLAACVKDCRCAEYARQRDEARAALEECAGHPKCRAALATARAEALERAKDAAAAAVYETFENEDRAVSKGSAEYGRGFMREAIVANVRNAIRALASDTKGQM